MASEMLVKTPPISPPANLSNHEDEPARQVTAPIPAPSVMTPTQLPAADLSVSEGESEWWRALDARLARAPRRPRFAARRLDPRLPSVTRTAAPTHLPMPPPQLRRQIDAAQMPDEARGTVVASAEFHAVFRASSSAKHDAPFVRPGRAHAFAHFVAK